MREKMGRGSKHLQKEQQKQINRYGRRQISEKKIPEKIAEELKDRTKKQNNIYIYIYKTIATTMLQYYSLITTQI